ncbi:Hypothetical predicted protein [Octopus vulgaris]|uniref:Uncharacterized protein n=1 Tax=Octopus vulgaris TaxID=6645 RepID=A0AA36BJU1_OCTVU|nr:Hypothetical predicted protein [Octopus vulgaris]
MALNTSWKSHTANADLYQGQQKVTLKIQHRRRLAGHCIRHTDEIANRNTKEVKNYHTHTKWLNIEINYRHRSGDGALGRASTFGAHHATPYLVRWMGIPGSHSPTKSRVLTQSATFRYIAPADDIKHEMLGLTAPLGG